LTAVAALVTYLAIRTAQRALHEHAAQTPVVHEHAALPEPTEARSD
jgi:hypothetical protein